MPTFDMTVDYDTAERLVVLFLAELNDSLNEWEDDDPDGYVRDAINLLLERLMTPEELSEWRM